MPNSNTRSTSRSTSRNRNSNNDSFNQIYNSLNLKSILELTKKERQEQAGKNREEQARENREERARKNREEHARKQMNERSNKRMEELRALKARGGVNTPALKNYFYLYNYELGKYIWKTQNNARIAIRKHNNRLNYSQRNTQLKPKKLKFSQNN